MITVPQDSYVTVAQADDYFSIRPSVTQWEANTPEQKGRLLVAASDYLDDNFPLKNDLNKHMRDGTKPIPAAVIRAVCEIAINPVATGARTRMMDAVTVGPISVKYTEGETEYEQQLENIAGILGDLYDGGSGDLIYSRLVTA